MPSQTRGGKFCGEGYYLQDAAMTVLPSHNTS